jgi:hypothetical protein
MKVEMGKKYTSDGIAMRILCTDRHGRYPVVGMVEKTGTMHYFKENGEDMFFSGDNLVEVWEPKEGEYCWFWNTCDCSHTLAKFKKMSSSGNSYWDKYALWEHCAKFIGEVPEHLKDKE